ncbi:hypothetical protein [Streptomyces ginkgonis]|uniref:Secreted protein n=1 Tax=Streptomyces harbinensis TaxID=1176198 RepID=A0A1I6WB40_9ACTN|nr:hypothetical protein [Streptomyces ginkgonis]SFT23226.1 hypothetical protein SAMN05444716_1173 [Streptomyces harbinensis]
MNRIKKFFGVASAGVLMAGVLVGGTVATAGTAHATPSDCQRYLQDRGYSMTSDRIDGCAYGARDGIVRLFCVALLNNSGVSQSHTETACRLAAA